MKQKFKSVKEKNEQIIPEICTGKGKKQKFFFQNYKKGNHTVRNIIRESHFSIDILLFSTLF